MPDSCHHPTCPSPCLGGIRDQHNTPKERSTAPRLAGMPPSHEGPQGKRNRQTWPRQKASPVGRWQKGYTSHALAVMVTLQTAMQSRCTLTQLTNHARRRLDPDPETWPVTMGGATVRHVKFCTKFPMMICPAQRWQQQDGRTDVAVVTWP